MGDSAEVCGRCGQPLREGHARFAFTTLPLESVPSDLALCGHCTHSLRYWYQKGRKRFEKGESRHNSRSRRSLGSGSEESDWGWLILGGVFICLVIAGTAFVTYWLMNPPAPIP